MYRRFMLVLVAALFAGLACLAYPDLRSYAVYESLPFQIPLESTVSVILDFCTVSVILEEVQLVYNYSVGNEWRLSLLVNDQHVWKWELNLRRYREKKVSYRPFQIVWTGTETFTGSTTLTVTAIAVEDDIYPDVGTAAATFTVACLFPAQTATLDVLVRESHGRYKGAPALWRFQIRVEVSQ